MSFKSLDVGVWDGGLGMRACVRVSVNGFRKVGGRGGGPLHLIMMSEFTVSFNPRGSWETPTDEHLAGFSEVGRRILIRTKCFALPNPSTAEEVRVAVAFTVLLPG